MSRWTRRATSPRPAASFSSAGKQTSCSVGARRPAAIPTSGHGKATPADSRRSPLHRETTGASIASARPVPTHGRVVTRRDTGLPDCCSRPDPSVHGPASALLLRLQRPLGPRLRNATIAMARCDWPAAIGWRQGARGDGVRPCLRGRSHSRKIRRHPRPATRPAAEQPARTRARGAALGSVDSTGMAAFPDDVVKGLVRLVCRPFGQGATRSSGPATVDGLPSRVPVIFPRASAPGTKSQVYDRQAGGIARSRQILCGKTRPQTHGGSPMTGRAVRQPSFRRGFQKVSIPPVVRPAGWRA